jgi:hypothetical protein
MSSVTCQISISLDDVIDEGVEGIGAYIRKTLEADQGRRLARGHARQVPRPALSGPRVRTGEGDRSLSHKIAALTLREVAAAKSSSGHPRARRVRCAQGAGRAVRSAAGCPRSLIRGVENIVSTFRSMSAVT